MVPRRNQTGLSIVPRVLFSFCLRLMLSAGVLFASLWPIGMTPPNYSPPWQIDLVDDGGGHDVGMYSALAVDREGAYQIAYYDSSDKALRYAFRRKSDKQWFKMSVDEDAGTFVSLAVDAQGRPHMAYNSSKGLRHAYWDNERWHIQTIDPVPTQFFTSIQLDALGNPRVTYFELSVSHADKEGAENLKYAFFDGKTWYKETIEQEPRQEPYDSLALDKTGHPHIVYAEFERLQYAYAKGSQWIFEPVDPSVHGHVRSGLSIALDANNNPNIAYFDITKKTLTFVSRIEGNWKTEVVDELSAEPSPADGVSLKIDSRDQPHIAYDDSGSGVLKYAAREGGKWVAGVVDRQGNVDTHPSLCLDSNDQPYISYYDLTNRQLRLARPVTSPATRIKDSELKQAGRGRRPRSN